MIEVSNGVIHAHHFTHLIDPVTDEGSDSPMGPSSLRPTTGMIARHTPTDVEAGPYACRRRRSRRYAFRETVSTTSMGAIAVPTNPTPSPTFIQVADGSRFLVSDPPV